jgi:hypothetical protein
MYSVHITGIHSGVYLGVVPYVSFRMPVSLNAGEGGEVVIPVTEFDAVSASDPTSDLKYLTIPDQRFVVICWDDTPVAVGNITKRAYSHSNKTLTLTIRDIWSIIGRRYLLQPGVSVSASDLRFGPASWESLAAAVVQQISAKSDYRDNLPIIFPSFKAGPSTLRYRGYNGHNALEALEDIIRWGDIDVYFRPHWVNHGLPDKHLQFEMQVGPSLNTSQTLDLNIDAGDAAVDFTFTEDASEMVTRAIVVGEGSGKKTKVADYNKPDNDYYIVTEGIFPDKRNDSEAKLLQVAKQWIKWRGQPAESIEVSVGRGTIFTAADLIPGMRIKVQAANDAWLPDEQTFRLAGYELSSSGPTKLDLQ